ncbi:hypothetical protein ACGFXB_47575 [Streptomyces canus]|uniref:hypothetical protein n=1 Tax=Streptomyces canus TaxID=58343 RepID=UPI003718A2B8
MDALPLDLQVVIFLMAVGVATITTALADALDDAPVSCCLGRRRPVWSAAPHRPSEP